MFPYETNQREWVDTGHLSQKQMMDSKWKLGTHQEYTLSSFLFMSVMWQREREERRGGCVWTDKYTIMPTAPNMEHENASLSFNCWKSISLLLFSAIYIFFYFLFYFCCHILFNSLPCLRKKSHCFKIVKIFFCWKWINTMLSIIKSKQRFVPIIYTNVHNINNIPTYLLPLLQDQKYQINHIFDYFHY